MKERNNIWSKLFISLAIILLSFLMAQVLVSVLISLAPTEISQNIHTANPEDLSSAQISFLKVLQFIAAIFTFLLPAIVIALIFSRNIGETLFLKQKSSFWVYLLSSLVLISSIPWMNMVIEWNAEINLPFSLEVVFKALEEAAMRSTEIMLQGDGFSTLLINILLLALVPALGEEIFFRGLIQGMIYKYSRNKHLAVIVAAFLFSAIHFQFYGFVPRMLLGAFFGYLVIYTNSIWPAVWAHFLNNSMAVVSYFILGNDISGIDDLGSKEQNAVFILVSIVISGMLMYLLFRKSKRVLQ
jgi:uncharacterized protein